MTPTPALIHDYLLTMRGAERTFSALAAAWPDATIYTLLFDPDGTQSRFIERTVVTSRLQRLRIRQEGFRRFLPLFPFAAARLPVNGHQLVVSSSSAFAHGVRVAPEAVHVCYCHSPFRYAWHHYRQALDEVPRAYQPGLGLLLRRIRRWDESAAARVTQYVANSRATQHLIHEFYAREAVIVHPPVEVERFHVGEPQEYFLVVCELVRHKRVENALAAARRAGVKIKVVGSGPDRPRLQAQYGDVGEFLGRVDDSELAALYASARALLVPGVEEFGIAAVEAQAAGRPVIAAGAGGALETILDGDTGVFVPVNDVDAMAEALRSVEFERFDSQAIVRHAQQFRISAFQARMRSVVETAWNEHNGAVVPARRFLPNPHETTTLPQAGAQ